MQDARDIFNEACKDVLEVERTAPHLKDLDDYIWETFYNKDFSVYVWDALLLDLEEDEAHRKHVAEGVVSDRLYWFETLLWEGGPDAMQGNSN